jgi:L-threonylcarbamoyladenylate synthase
MEAKNEQMEEDLRSALKVLKEGGVILYPTDTIWGIGCDATNEAAVKRVYEIKKREDSKALISLTDSPSLIERLADMPTIAYDLIDAATTPLTIIYEGARNLAPNLMAEDGSVGIRVTKELFSQELCKRLRRPLVSTSANISGEPSPQNFSEVSEEIKNQMDYIVKYRQNDKTKKSPSKIIKLWGNGEIKIIRS